MARGPPSQKASAAYAVKNEQHSSRRRNTHHTVSAVLPQLSVANTALYFYHLTALERHLSQLLSGDIILK